MLLERLKANCVCALMGFSGAWIGAKEGVDWAIKNSLCKNPEDDLKLDFSNLHKTKDKLLFPFKLLGGLFYYPIKFAAYALYVGFTGRYYEKGNSAFLRFRSSGLVERNERRLMVSNDGCEVEITQKTINVIKRSRIQKIIRGTCRVNDGLVPFELCRIYHPVTRAIENSVLKACNRDIDVLTRLEHVKRKLLNRNLSDKGLGKAILDIGMMR